MQCVGDSSVLDAHSRGQPNLVPRRSPSFISKTLLSYIYTYITCFLCLVSIRSLFLGICDLATWVYMETPIVKQLGLKLIDSDQRATKRRSK